MAERNHEVTKRQPLLDARETSQSRAGREDSCRSMTGQRSRQPGSVSRKGLLSGGRGCMCRGIYPIG